MVKIGIVDSGINSHLLPDNIAQQQRFYISGNNVWVDQKCTDPLGHGTEVAQIIHQHCPSAALYGAKVFDHRGRCHSVLIESAIEWLLEHDVDLINFSLGLRQHKESLERACQLALGEGTVLVASYPALGDQVFPAAYQGVISVTGDARCAVNEWSWFQKEGRQSLGPLYGAYVKGISKHAGASMACAHLSGLIASFMNREGTLSKQDIIHRLNEGASRMGPQKREPLKRGSK